MIDGNSDRQFLEGDAGVVVAFCLCGLLAQKSASARPSGMGRGVRALLLLPLLSPADAGLDRDCAVVGGHSPPVSGPPVARVVKRLRTGSRLAWLLGAGLVFARFALGQPVVWLTTRRASPIRIAGVGCGVPLLDAGAGAMPMTWGIFSSGRLAAN